MESVRGKLLVAGPTLQDPNFARTVVLVAEHTADGALGLVLNRPSEATIAQAAPELCSLTDDDDPIFVGGPVQPNAVVVLAEFEDVGDAALVVLDRVGFVRAGADLDEAAQRAVRARVYVGYAGWGPQQLDDELEGDDWIMLPASVQDCFAETPDRLWRDVLEREGGRYALLARMPADPRMN